MWEIIGSIGFSLFKMFLNNRAGRKLTDEETVKHIVFYQKERTGNVAKQTTDYKKNMADGLAALQKEEDESKSQKKD